MRSRVDPYAWDRCRMLLEAFMTQRFFEQYTTVNEEHTKSEKNS